ncbi:MAG: dihydrofolate reductase [Candidatus Liptonbacteria bacterium]|nr:dihydrofolate reductase [Candidatus Liptonbacteria bacterium]
MICIIVAIAKNRVIGKRGSGMLWHLPADLKRFKEITMGHTIIMGRRTHESIGKPLPGRTNIVITRQKDYSAPGCIVLGSLQEALVMVNGKESFVMGGGEVYEQALPLADKLYITEIEAGFEGDVYFPEIDKKIWKLVDKKEGTIDDMNLYPHRFLIFEKT